MDIKSFLIDVKQKICDDIEVFEESKDRFIVDTSFGFNNGDSFVIVLTKK